MATVTITWKAFGNRPEANRYISSATLELDGFYNVCSDTLLMNSIYKVTNLQSDLAEFGGAPAEMALWKSIQSVLPANRTHTSLSVGDEIEVRGTVYEITPVGFTAKVGA